MKGLRNGRVAASSARRHRFIGRGPAGVTASSAGASPFHLERTLISAAERFSAASAVVPDVASLFHVGGHLRPALDGSVVPCLEPREFKGTTVVRSIIDEAASRTTRINRFPAVAFSSNHEERISGDDGKLMSISATRHLDALAEAVAEGRPLVLLLGQDAWSDEKRLDQVLIAALKRQSRYSDETAGAGYPALLTASPLEVGFYDWLADLYERQPAAEWLEPVTALPWNAVFTTAIDPTLGRVFRGHGRAVEAVLSTQDSPASPRHRKKLHITYLFGRAGERLPEELPPRSLQELRTRAALHATPLLARVVETTTPLGILLVDGYRCGRDWLATEALAGTLGAFQPGQVFWFGSDPTLHALDPLIKELGGPSGPLVLIPERLATALRQLALANRLDLSVTARSVAEDSVSIGESLLQIPAATRLKTSTGAAILDDTWLAPLPPLGPDSEYSEFRRFHGHVEDSRRLVEGLRRGFAITRTFECILGDRVRSALGSAGKVQEPILIHGQSGSGKSLGLARLAYNIRSEKQYPVLLALRASRIPGVDELDEFCLKAEDAGAPATLLVCDANARASQYRDLVRGFSSRGRRVVVVGSTYRIIDSSTTQGPTSRILFESPAELEGAELADLASLLQRFTGSSPQMTQSAFLLPAVYRMLPEVRPLLSAGLAREARVAEDDLRKRGSTRSRIHGTGVGQLGRALIDAGVVDPKVLLEQRLDDFLGDMSDGASRAVDFVMVSGKLDCAVPVNLLMRALGGTREAADTAALFSGIDLFRWSTTDEGDIVIHPRLRIEAELICARRLGTAQAEAAIAIGLLAHASPNSHGSGERRFVLDLVHRLGPDGPYELRYSRSYLDLARALTEMRTRRGVLDPSLMLQEATLRRRVLRDAPEQAEVDPAAILEEARTVVDLALDEFSGSSSPGLRRMCANLKVERAAIYGYRAVQRLKQEAAIDEVWQFYEAARDSARSAVFSADTYFAIDISLWVPNDLLRGADWSPVRRAELVADILDALDRVDPAQLDPEQRVQYETRKLKVAQTLDDKKLEQEALEALESAGSRAGHYLRARALGGSLVGSGRPSSEELDRAKEAAAFLHEHQEAIGDDARCLRYLLKCQWLSRTGSYLFGGERAPLPTRDEDVRSVLELVERVRLVEGALGDPRIRYLQAVLLWRLRREHEARELWSELSRETEYSDARRVVRQHVWTAPDGRQQLFQGRIIADSGGRGRFRVLVEDIRQEVELLYRDFRELDLRRGFSVPGGFCIAFNYIGPIADRPDRRGSGG